ncbi:glycosyltransferase [Candidatus Levibacter sp. Uisw_134_01]|uniref:glycosyltransferase family 2 protein n=1 Tax=Candidatus Levibacter sp. Uisw_134_01 TaxID=3230999 RepID=UPI003D44B64C
MSNNINTCLKRPLVSIVLPVYNGEAFLRDTLKSLLAQSFTDFELLIADNASNDSTSDICQEYLLKDSRIIYHRHSFNKGLTANQEWLYRQAKGKYIMLVGDDDVYDPLCLVNCVDRIDNRNDIILVYFNYEWIDEKGNRSPSGLKIFMKPENKIFKNLYLFIRSPIVLPLGMGLFRTKLVQQAIPFPIYSNRYKDFTGSRDIGFLWKIIHKGQIDSIRTPLFAYRSKPRKTVPSSWGHSRFITKKNVIYLNWLILIKTILPRVWVIDLSFYQKVCLTFFAGFIFIAQYTLIPFFQKIRSYLFPNRMC